MEYADGISDAECREIRANATYQHEAERRGLTIDEFRAAVEAAENAPGGETPRERSERIRNTYQHHITEEEAQRATGVRRLIGRDTHDLPEWRPDGDRKGPAMLEARHDI